MNGYNSKINYELKECRTEADVTDLVENLGYKPNTPVATGIERFIKWYKQYFFLGDAHGTTLNFEP